MKIPSKKKGFSIPEVIIAITIVVLIIVTATNLLVSSTRANRSNINQIIAYNLAQEALEGVRNIRDSHWLHNINWRGDDEKRLLGDDFNSDGYYIIEKKRVDFDKAGCDFQSIENLNQLNTVKDNAPWNLTKIQNPGVDETLLFMLTDISGDIVKYRHEKNNEESIFRRWIEIEKIPYGSGSGEMSDDLKIKVTAFVSWFELSRERTLEVSTILTDWKAGPL